MFLYFYFDWKICDALFNTKTKLQNADYVLGNASICVYVKSVFVLCNVMGFMII
jgi:Trk-type K+ transport system membrane component